MKRYHITSGFAKLGGKVTTRTATGTKTAGDNPNGVWLNPQLRKAASALCESEQKRGNQRPKV